MARQILADYDFGGISRLTNLPEAVEDSQPVILSQLKAYTGGPILETYQVISEDYTIVEGKSGTSLGPISIAEGFTVTVSQGSTWKVLPWF